MDNEKVPLVLNNLLKTGLSSASAFCSEVLTTTNLTDVSYGKISYCYHTQKYHILGKTRYKRRAIRIDAAGRNTWHFLGQKCDICFPKIDKKMYPDEGKSRWTHFHVCYKCQSVSYIEPSYAIKRVLSKPSTISKAQRCSTHTSPSAQSPKKMRQ